jgi:triacylglycerol esterase/lipase EstA (alpha/beta hydrolase family)
MIALLLKLLLLLQLVLTGALALLLQRFLPIEHPLLAWVLALLSVLLLRGLITANHFRLSGLWLRRHSTNLRASGDLFFDEYLATLLASCWTMAWPKVGKYIVPDSTRLPVLLVHGYICNRGYWRQLSKLLVQARISYLAVDLEPVGAAMDENLPSLLRAIETLCVDTGSDRVIILAHSMGGLVARAYLRSYGRARIAHVITLGTPHYGTRSARFGFGRNALQMRRNGSVSDWLSLLDKEESAVQRHIFTSIFSVDDNIVVPQRSGYLPGAKNIEFCGIGHVALGRNRRVLDCVLNEIGLVEGGIVSADMAPH